MSTAMPVCSIRASRSTSGSSTSASSRVPPRSSISASSASARSRTARACSIAVVAGAPSSSSASKAELVVVGRRPGLQLALEVAQGQVGQVVGALVGPDEVGRERGVAGQPGERPAARGQREHRALGVVEHLGPRGVGQPRRERGVVLGRRPRPTSTQAACPSPRRQRDATRTSPVPAPQRALDGRTPTRVPGPACSSSQAGDLAGGQARRRRARSRTRRPRGVLVGVPWSPAAGRAAPRNSSSSKQRVHRAWRSHGWRLEVGRGAARRSRSRTSALRWRLRMTSPRCSRSASPFLPVISSAWAMTLSRPSYCVDPLRREARPDAGHAGQVVGGLADDGRQLGVAVRRDAVLRPRPRPASSGPARRRRASGRAPSSRSVTSWRESRSPVRISTSMPSASAWVTRVAMMSSAS